MTLSSRRPIATFIIRGHGSTSLRRRGALKFEVSWTADKICRFTALELLPVNQVVLTGKDPES
jgi:hypothetical protein